jgi:hypothetical protein
MAMSMPRTARIGPDGPRHDFSSVRGTIAWSPRGVASTPLTTPA